MVRAGILAVMLASVVSGGCAAAAVGAAGAAGAQMAVNDQTADTHVSASAGLSQWQTAIENWRGTHFILGVHQFSNLTPSQFPNP